MHSTQGFSPCVSTLFICETSVYREASTARVNVSSRCKKMSDNVNVAMFVQTFGACAAVSASSALQRVYGSAWCLGVIFSLWFFSPGGRAGSVVGHYLGRAFYQTGSCIYAPVSVFFLPGLLNIFSV